MKDTKKHVIYMDDEKGIRELILWDSFERAGKLIGVLINEFGYEEVIRMDLDRIFATY